MAERIIKPIGSDGKVTIPKDMRKEYELKDYVEISRAKEGILIKKH